MDRFQHPLAGQPASALVTSHNICRKAGELVVDWSQSSLAESHGLVIEAGKAGEGRSRTGWRGGWK